MHTRKINLLSAIVLTSVLGFGAVGANASATLRLDEPATMRQAQELLQGQEWEQAVEVLRALVKEDPKDAQAQFMLGYALHASGDIDNAILVHKKATKMPAVAPMAFYNLGCAYALKGETTDAFEALNTAIALGVRDVAQFSGDTDLRSLHSDERWAPMLKSIDAITKAESALHFWVGTWDCYDSTTGKLAGKNTLAFRVGNKVIHESWVSSGGQYSGESWNVYNRESNAWEQTWVDTTGNLLHIEAPVDSDEYDGLMFEGKNIATGNKPSLSRMHVRPIEDGRVMQTGFSSKNKGKTWTKQYEFIYVPAGEAFALEAED